MQIFSMFRGHINPPSSEAITQIHPSVTFEKISCELVVTGGNHYALEINQLYGHTDLELDLPLRVFLWSLDNDSINNLVSRFSKGKTACSFHPQSPYVSKSLN